LINQESLKGIVFDIQRYSIHDGPGIRTLVFLKGCPLRCIWCSNPESHHINPQISFYPSRCIGCGTCIKVCQKKAIRVLEGGGKFVDMNKCNLCGKCIESCYPEALVLLGKCFTVEELMEEIEKDRPFYDKSGGGVTLTGGEPMFQTKFSYQVLQECRKKAIHTAIETCGYADWENFEMVLPYVDLVFYDIKHMDPNVHLKLTGVSNKSILENARRIVKMKKKLIPRFPIIPYCNDSKENIINTGRFVKNELGLNEIHLLPYHRLGEVKYKRLGINYSLAEFKPFEKEQVNEFKKILEDLGLRVAVGG